jgi:glucan phosphorylase
MYKLSAYMSIKDNTFVFFISFIYIRNLNQIKKHPFSPVYLFLAVKQQPGYVFAKLIIRLINAVADVVNNDSEVNEKMKLYFFQTIA